MKISTNFNIQRETLQEAPNWIDRILSPLNSTMNLLLQALQTNLVLEENIVGQIRTLKFLTTSTYTSANFFNTLIIPWAYDIKKHPQIVIVGQVIQPSNQPVLTSPVTVPTWTYDDISSIRIPYITGLKDSSQYEVTFLIL